MTAKILLLSLSVSFGAWQLFAHDLRLAYLLYHVALGAFIGWFIALIEETLPLLGKDYSLWNHAVAIAFSIAVALQSYHLAQSYPYPKRQLLALVCFFGYVAAGVAADVITDLCFKNGRIEVRPWMKKWLTDAKVE